MHQLAPDEGGDDLLGDPMAGEYVSEVEVGLINGVDTAGLERIIVGTVVIGVVISLLVVEIWEENF